EPDPARRFSSHREFALALAEAVDDGLSIVGAYAKALTVASVTNPTLGRMPAPEIVARPPEIVTSRDRPIAIAQPTPVAPGSRGVDSPPTVPVAQSPRTISTLSGSAGQAVATRAPERTKRGLVTAAIGALVIGGAIVAIVVSQGSSKDTGPTV